ncbi:MAG TPA: methyl-accepting chemotaxis protein [Bacillota bacterium]|nr:methyl-accepting chemotaxis protein [Bacillota bacterium]
MRIGDLKIGVRLGLGFGLLLALITFITLIGINNMRKIQDDLENIYKVNDVKIALANEMRTCMSSISLEMRNILLEDEQAASQEANRRLEAAREKYGESLSKLEEMDNTAEGRAQLARVAEVIASAKNVNDKVLALSLAQKDGEALPLLVKESGPAMVKIDNALEELVRLQEDSSRAAFDEARNAYAGARFVMFLAGGTAIALGIIVTLLITRSITVPVAALVKAANTVYSGDLTADVAVGSKDEIGRLAGAFKDMIGQMRDLVRQIVEKAAALSSSARQLDSNSQQTSAAAGENAATMGEISTAVEQVSANMQKIAESSEAASAYAREGSGGIEKVTRQMVDIAGSTEAVSRVIGELNKKSQEINRIVGLITGIADQTNLLALNAAIEAARAGEQGRGFAVVAEEVRKLAEQSASATKEISGLIASIQLETQKAVENMAQSAKEVETGIAVVKEAGDNFKHIISAVQILTQQIQDVAAATEEMTAGVENVTASTEEQTSAMEEVSASAEALSMLAVGLNQAAGKFKV